MDHSRWRVSDTRPLVSLKMLAFGSLLFCSFRAVLDLVFLDILVDLEVNSDTNLATIIKIYYGKNNRNEPLRVGNLPMDNLETIELVSSTRESQ